MNKHNNQWLSRNLSQAGRHNQNSLAGMISRALLVSAGLSLALPGTVRADSDSDDLPLEEITTIGVRQDGYRVEEVSSVKFTELLRDTPQSITSLTDRWLDERGVMSLNDALRNVPGITLGAGEFTWQGNNPNIRGFSSRNDMFLDGMRDFGSYSRDPFNLEAIEVLQGPSSMIFGRGSTGGVINQVSKMPVPDPLRNVNLNMGNADTFRATADINQPFDALGHGAAFRLNLMRQEGGVPGRDGAEIDKWGIAPTFAVSLGEHSRLTLSYLKLKDESVPDYGLPWVNNSAPEVDRENFYGFETDFLNTDADIFSLRLDHDFGAGTTANALLRYAKYSRESRISEPLVAATTPGTPLDQITVDRNVFQGNSEEDMLSGQFNLVKEFSTGSIGHSLVTGFEFAHESSAPTFGFALGVPSTNLAHPVSGPFTSTGSIIRAQADTSSDSLAAYVLDTIKFNEHWQLVAGLRWDRFEVDYSGIRSDPDGNNEGFENLSSTDSVISPRLAAVYKPVENGTVYLGWGTSFNPSAEGLSFIANARNFGVSNAFLDPEKNESVELGTKWELLDTRLSLEAAIFQIEKTNARVPDPENPGFNLLAGKQSVTGASFNISGRVFSKLSVSGGYTWLDSEQSGTLEGAANQGQPLLNVAKHSMSVWLNYFFTDRFDTALGVRHVGERLASNSPPVKSVPGYWVVDAMAKYEFSEHFTFKVNLTNLTDEYYLDQLHPWHVVPGPGRGIVFAVNTSW